MDYKKYFSCRKKHDYQVIFVKTPLKRRCKKALIILLIVLVCLIICCLILLFVVFPVVFKYSIGLQRLLMFTTLGLPQDPDYFKNLEVPGKRNLYVSVKDEFDDQIISLGVWHLLPHNITNGMLNDTNFDYENSLKNSNYSVLLYFHGNGEARSYNTIKYGLLRFFFHVITFDYRSYADSTSADLTEDGVVNDCIQLYRWLVEKTDAPIYIWGHSLGTALATRTMASLTNETRKPVGLILESAFTTMEDEVYLHPIGKLFSWLPYFKVTIPDPLRANNFIFNTAKHILTIESPIMLFTAEDDWIVPYELAYKLAEIARHRSVDSTVLYYQFPGVFRYNHIFIYEDPFMPYFIRYFMYICQNYTAEKYYIPNYGITGLPWLKEEIKELVF